MVSTRERHHEKKLRSTDLQIERGSELSVEVA